MGKIMKDGIQYGVGGITDANDVKYGSTNVGSALNERPTAYQLNLRVYANFVAALPNIKTYYAGKPFVVINGTFSGGAMYLGMIWCKDTTNMFAIIFSSNSISYLTTSDGGDTWG